MSKVLKMVLNITLPLIFYWDACYIVVFGDVKDVFAHNFLHIHPIFNLGRVLKSWDLELCILKHVGDVNISMLCTYCSLMSEMCNIFDLMLKMVWITMCVIIQTILIKEYFELMLWIKWNFKLKPCINSK